MKIQKLISGGVLITAGKRGWGGGGVWSDFFFKKNKRARLFGTLEYPESLLVSIKHIRRSQLYLFF